MLHGQHSSAALLCTMKREPVEEDIFSISFCTVRHLPTWGFNNLTTSTFAASTCIHLQWESARGRGSIQNERRRLCALTTLIIINVTPCMVVEFSLCYATLKQHDVLSSDTVEICLKKSLLTIAYIMEFIGFSTFIPATMYLTNGATKNNIRIL